MSKGVMRPKILFRWGVLDSQIWIWGSCCPRIKKRRFPQLYNIYSRESHSLRKYAYEIAKEVIYVLSVPTGTIDSSISPLRSLLHIHCRGVIVFRNLNQIPRFGSIGSPIEDTIQSEAQPLSSVHIPSIVPHCPLVAIPAHQEQLW